MPDSFENFLALPKPWLCAVDPIHQLIYCFRAVIAFKEEYSNSTRQKSLTERRKRKLEKNWKSYWNGCPENAQSLAAKLMNFIDKQTKPERTKELLNPNLIASFAEVCHSMINTRDNSWVANCNHQSVTQSHFASDGSSIAVYRAIKGDLFENLTLDDLASVLSKDGNLSVVGNYAALAPYVIHKMIDYWKRVLSYLGIEFVEWGSERKSNSEGSPDRLDRKGEETTQPVQNEKSTYLSLLDIYTNGISERRIKDVEQVSVRDNLTVSDKLNKIDELMPIPAITTANKLAKLFNVTKQAVLKSEWWKLHRKGKREDEIERRKALHKPPDRRHKKSTIEKLDE